MKTSSPDPARNMIRSLVAAFLTGISTACTTTRIDVAQHGDATANGVEGVVVLARRHHGTQDTEQSFMECVKGALLKESAAIRLYPEKDFVDALFPWFEARTAPATLEALAELQGHPRVSERLASLGVRYLVWVDGRSEDVDGGGGLSCAVGPGGGGCFGFVWWDTASTYEAVIWDLQENTSLGAVNTDASGMSYVPALIVPIPLIARTQSAACHGLVEQLKPMLGAKGAI